LRITHRWEKTIADVISGGLVMKCRIMIADDHELVRVGVRAFLEQCQDLCVCCEATDGHDAIEKAGQYHPDISIMDIGMPVTNGIVAARRILKNAPGHRILILTVPEPDETIRAALESGIRGLVYKTDPLNNLLDAVNEIRRNRTFFTAQVGDMILKEYLLIDQGPVEQKNSPEPMLTLRERETLQLIAEGKSTKEVAMCLGLAVKTAETHRGRVLRKLRLHNATELTLYAIRHSIIEVPVLNDQFQNKTLVAGVTK
jgi:DNA-binding NarL/FixJ family response regulator